MKGPWMHCPVCRTPIDAASDGTRTVASCSQCGSGVTVPPPDRDVTSDGLFEEGSYAGGRLDRRAQWIYEARQRMDWIAEHLASGTLLEIGPATGEFLKTAGDLGLVAYGVETSAWAAQQAAEFAPAADIHTGYLSDWLQSHPGLKVDAVAAFHVLEHVPDPAGFLNEIRTVLVPGGLLFLEVPNWGSADAQRDRASWELALVDDHVVHFTRKSLSGLLTRQEFDPIAVAEETWQLYDPRKVWMRRRLSWLKRGQLTPSRDLLRVIAQCPTDSLVS